MTSSSPLSFLYHIRPEFLPPSLSSSTLPNQFNALSTLQTCKTIREDHKFIRWITSNAQAILATPHEILRPLANEISQHALRVFFFILCLQPNAIESTNHCFPNLSPDQTKPFYDFCIVLQTHLSGRNNTEIQHLILDVYVEYLDETFNLMLQKTRKNLNLTLLVPPSAHLILALLKTLGYPPSHLPKPFATSTTPLPRLSIMDALSIIMLKLPNHIEGFKPEEEFAQLAYGNPSTSCLHQVLVLQCQFEHIHTFWKCMKWPISKNFQRRIRHYKGYGILESQDIVTLLRHSSSSSN